MGLLSEQRTMQKFTKHKIKTDLITPPPSPSPEKKQLKFYPTLFTPKYRAQI